MASGDALALAALVVGLVALVIASGQLIQQMFSTVDGYRRCKHTVIGPWSKKTRLVWHWNQFRFETRFTTPEIVLYDWRALQMANKANSVLSSGPRSKLSSIIDFDRKDLPYELEETVRPSQIVDDGDTSGDMVSWTSLLQQLYFMQSEWYQSYSTHQTPPLDPTKVVGYGTKIGVIYRERTWDLMPPETIRPMASSRLGTVIVLAIRLGMTWENLDIGDGALRAEGNGHTLLSTPMRGFGIVFQYNFNADMESMRGPRQLLTQASSSIQGLIPRRSTDMLSCGIIPGVPSLGIPAIPIKGKNFAESASLLSAALLWLNVSRSTIAKVASPEQLQAMQEKGFEAPVGWPINDMIALTSSFQPLTGSTKTQSVYPIDTNLALSCFLMPECRSRLLRHLKQHADRRGPDRDHLQQVCLRFESLSQQHHSDFVCEWDKAVVNDPSATLGTKLDFIQDLSEIYRWTVDYFKRIDHQLKYARIVAAHITLATNAGFQAYSQIRRSTSQSYWEATADGYISNLDALNSELRQFVIPSQNQTNVDDLIDDAWWTLMLRGIVWRMSVYFSHQETVVPSRLYYDQTPVYIM